MKEEYQISPVLRVLLPLAFGAFAGMKMNTELPGWPLLALCFLFWLLMFLVTVRPCGTRPERSLLFMALFFLLVSGTGLTLVRYDRHSDPGLKENRNFLVRGRVVKVRGSPGERYSFELLTSMLACDTVPEALKTRLIVYMERVEGSVQPQPGEEWQLEGRVVPVRSSGRAGDPDYRAILARKNCFYRFYVSSFSTGNRELPETGSWIPDAFQLRERISCSWRGDTEVKALLMAVCLGDRSGLDPALKSAYADAGGMHLLAVSGLHVGLIWMILNFTLGFLSRISRKETLRVILLTLILWLYAYVTGFSVSVCRSVCMFSLYSLARLIRTGVDPIHVTCVSALLLLLIRPSWIMDAGFQLSYVAVFSILTLYPLIRKLFRIRFILFRKLWEMTCVSLTAQLGTLPLVIHYFNQVPVFGLLTNIFALPLLSGILIVFVASVPLNLAGSGNTANEVLSILGDLLNRLMKGIGSLERAVITNLYPGSLQTISFLILTFLLVLAWRRHRITPMIPALFIAAFLVFLLTI